MYLIQDINGTPVIFSIIPGYLNFTHGAFHYVFFDSQRDPDNDPVILWLNGGPGCSSLIGMVYENGPFVFLPNTTKLVPNEHAWNQKANLLYITSPQGVRITFSVGWIQYRKSLKTRWWNSCHIQSQSTPPVLHQIPQSEEKRFLYGWWKLCRNLYSLSR